MKLSNILMVMVFAVILNGCVAYAPRTCSSAGYEKDSAEYKACIRQKQRNNYNYDSGIGGGGP